MLLVTGTTVTIPRPRRVAAALARSLLTMTAGRCVLASLPRAGSRSTCHTSPRSIDDAVPGRGFPVLALLISRPLRPRFGVILLKVGVAQHLHRALQACRPRRQACFLDVGVQHRNVVLG